MNPTSPPHLPLAVRPPKSSETVIPAYYTDIPVGNRPAGSAGANESGLIYYWRLIRRRKGTLVVIAFLGGMAGVLATLPQPRMYKTSASIEIHDPNSPAPEYAASDAYIQTQVKILQSKSLTEQVLAKMTAAGELKPEADRSRLSALKQALGLKKESSLSSKRLERELAGSLVVRTAGQTRVAEISAESDNPQLVAAFLNTLAAEFIKQDLEPAQSAGGPLTREVDQWRTKLEASEERLHAYERRAGLGGGYNTPGEKLKQLQQDLAAVKTDRAAKQAYYEQAKTAPIEAPPDGLTTQATREAITKLDDLKRQLAELSTKFTSEHYRIVAIQEQIAAQHAALQKDRAAIIERARNTYEEALRREKQLGEAYSEQTRVVDKAADQGVEHDALKREVESNRLLYQQVLQKMKETVAPATRPRASRVIDPAEAPDRPYKPSLPQNVALGVLGGVLFGMAFIVFREQADRAIQQPGEASTFLKIPELGVIPAADGNAGTWRGRRLHARKESSKDGVAAGDLIPAMQRAEFIISNKSDFGFVESIRAVLLSIVYSGKGEDSRRVLVFTSSNPGEGKTTVATNLAMAFAGLSRRVLLIDADLRRPRIHDIFGLSNHVGLGDLLEGKVPPDHNAIRESTVKNLFVLTSGGSVAESAILMYENKLHELVERFRAEFDIVIFDTPPLLQIADARVMGRIADALILVVRAGRTTRDAVAAAYERLAEDKIPVLGVILNDWNPRTTASGYYGSYDGSYSKYHKPYASQSKQAN